MNQNLELWCRQAEELGLSRQVRKGLLFFCGGYHSFGPDNADALRLLNWFSEMDPSTDLASECGELRDGKVMYLLEEAIALAGVEVEFRDITIGDVTLKAFNPQLHGNMDWDPERGFTMFSIDTLMEQLFQRIGDVLEEGDFDDELSYRSGAFFFNTNVRTDLKGFMTLYDVFRELLAPRFGYLADMPNLGSIDDLERFTPFSRVLYGLMKGLSPELVEPVWQFHWFMLEVVEKSELPPLLDLDPFQWAGLVEGGLHQLEEQGSAHFDGIPRGILVEDGFPRDVPINDRKALLMSALDRKWAGMQQALDDQASGVRVTCLVCIFYVMIGLWIEISGKHSDAVH